MLLLYDHLVGHVGSVKLAVHLQMTSEVVERHTTSRLLKHSAQPDHLKKHVAGYSVA